MGTHPGDDAHAMKAIAKSVWQAGWTVCVQAYSFPLNCSPDRRLCSRTPDYSALRPSSTDPSDSLIPVLVEETCQNDLCRDAVIGATVVSTTAKSGSLGTCRALFDRRIHESWPAVEHHCISAIRGFG